MKIYLAARYSRREEMQSAAADLAQVGHQVTSRWHIGDAHHASEAEEDIEDLQRAELVISFTIVGPRENVFHALAEVFPTWAEALAAAAGARERE